MATITTTHKGEMLFESKIGRHAITMDVPPDMGGADRAPTPPQFFVASLGACVAAFIASYCQQAGIDATDLSVDVSFDKAENPTRLVNLKVSVKPVSYTHLRAHETVLDLVCRLLLEKKKLPMSHTYLNIVDYTHHNNTHY